jgi:hypothetical protein
VTKNVHPNYIPWVLKYETVPLTVITLPLPGTGEHRIICGVVINPRHLRFFYLKGAQGQCDMSKELHHKASDEHVKIPCWYAQAHTGNL